MKYILLYKDKDLQCIIDFYNKKKTQAQINKIAKQYEQIGFYGKFTQVESK